MQEALLNNPVFNALNTRDKPYSFGTEKVKYFDEAMSPFVGIEDGYEQGFDELREILPGKRYILYATPEHIDTPSGWKLIQKVQGVQMVYAIEGPGGQLAGPGGKWGGPGNELRGTGIEDPVRPIKLEEKHIPEMMELARLTVPGPFGPRTIDFGFYYGIFKEDKLVAMTGQRLHVEAYAEVSAVCTHPDHLGKGYASILVQHQLKLILDQGHIPFLHVREDNSRAINIYERLGFKIRTPMNFYFMKLKGN